MSKLPIDNQLSVFSYSRSNYQQSQQSQAQNLITEKENLDLHCAQLQIHSVFPQDQLTRVIYILLMPFVCILGSIGAAICILVFTRRQMRSSLSIYLAGLSVFDLILLLMSLVIYPSMNMCLQDGNKGLVCHFFWRSSLATYPLSLIAQTGSVWTCVAITIDRFLAVQYPLHTRVWCTPYRARIVLHCIAVVAVLYKMPSIFELSLDKCGRLKPTQLRNHPLYIIIYNTYGYLLLLLVIPFFIIIVLNIIIINAIRAANIRRQKMLYLKPRRSNTYNDNTRNNSIGTKKNKYRFLIISTIHYSTQVKRSSVADSNILWDNEKKWTKMAIVTIITFIVFNWLAGINNVIEAFRLDVSGDSYRIPIGNLLVCLNSATNILIYSIFGQKFRKLCATLLCTCCNCFKLQY